MLQEHFTPPVYNYRRATPTDFTAQLPIRPLPSGTQSRLFELSSAMLDAHKNKTIQVVAHINTGSLIDALKSIITYKDNKVPIKTVIPTLCNYDGTLTRRATNGTWTYSLLGYAIANSNAGISETDLEGQRIVPHGYFYADGRSLAHAIHIEQVWQFFAWAAHHPDQYTIVDISLMQHDVSVACQNARATGLVQADESSVTHLPHEGLYLAIDTNEHN